MALAGGGGAIQPRFGPDVLQRARRLQAQNQLLRRRLELLENPPSAPGLGAAVKAATGLQTQTANLLQVPLPAPTRFRDAAPFAKTLAAVKQQGLANAVGEIAAAKHQVFEDSYGDFHGVLESNEASTLTMKTSTAQLRQRAEAEQLRPRTAP